jgi:hypothetical protein
VRQIFLAGIAILSPERSEGLAVILAFALGKNSGSAGPLHGGKGSAWEGGSRVPCIFRWTGSPSIPRKSFRTSVW